MATQKLVVEGTSVTASQVSEMFRQFGVGKLTGFHVQEFIEHRNPFETNLDEASQLTSWCALLKDLFGLEIDSSAVKIPKPQSGFNRLIVVPKGLTLNRIIEVCREKFENVYCAYDNLDQAVTQNDRTNDETYAIWIRNRVEADEELKNLSADQLKEKKISGITLTERLLLGLKYFSETKKYLDLQNVTLCSGSRCSGGGVPDVFWDVDNRWLYVYWHRADDRGDNLRARAAVS